MDFHASLRLHAESFGTAFDWWQALPQCGHRINVHGPPGRYHACRQCHQREEQRHDEKHGRVVRRHAEQLTGYQPTDRHRQSYVGEMVLEQNLFIGDFRAVTEGERRLARDEWNELLRGLPLGGPRTAFVSIQTVRQDGFSGALSIRSPSGIFEGATIRAVRRPAAATPR